MGSISVLIVDDHPVVRDGTYALLLDAPGIEVTGDAANGEEALEQARRLRPDVVLMDLFMPKMGGIEATRAILAEQPEICVLVLSGTSADERILAAIAAGAVGYLPKDSTREEFIRAIRQVARGESSLPPEMTRKVLEAMKDPLTAKSSKAITGRELEVLKLIAKGLSNQQIADRINIAEVTVRTHVSRIFGKLGLRNRVEAVLHALRQGLASLDGVD